MRYARRLLAALAAFALILAACQASRPIGGGTQGAVPSDVGVGPRSTFVVATPAGLLGLDASGRPLGRIVDLPQGAVPSGVSLGPDGNTLFFALSETRSGVGFGSDIYRVNVDGSDLRVLIAREGANVFYASPSADASGGLYVHRRMAKDDPTNPGVYLGTTDAIERLDLASGVRRKVLDDGAEPNFVPGGKALIFVHLDRGQQAGIWTARADGTGAAPLLKTGDSFWWLQSPRLSPNGNQLTWSSAGRANPKSASPSVVARGGTGNRLAHLDIPSELYVAPLDGTSLKSIALTRDDVVPAWSADSTKIAYIALSTFYVVAAADGEVITHTEGIGFNYGDLVWLPK
jgi:Tol biopolymer transport system component